MIVTTEIARSIARHARETYPYECCGALLGNDANVASVLPLPNTSDEPQERRFTIRPGDYRLAEKRAEQEGHELLGFYHSHPNHSASPSAFDLAHAWPNLTYLILSIERDRVGDMTAWLLSDDRSRFNSIVLHTR